MLLEMIECQIQLSDTTHQAYSRPFDVTAVLLADHCPATRGASDGCVRYGDGTEAAVSAEAIDD